MKFSTIIVIILLILALYYYTSETFEIVEVVGENVYAFVANVIKDLREEKDRGNFREVEEDIDEVEDVLKNIIDEIKKNYKKN